MDSINIGTMFKSGGLIALSFFLLPYTATIALVSFILSRRIEYKWFKLPTPTPHRGPERTILVTGVSMTKGLVIARLLAKHATKTGARYRIIGADIEPVPFTSPGRYTRAISEFYRLDGGSSFHYKQSLLDIIRNERVNLWISCSGVVHEVDDGSVAELAKARADSEPDGYLFHALQFPQRIVERLHSKDSFIQYLASLGLPHPISHLCTSAGQVECLLSHNAGENIQRVKVAKAQRRFILKPLGVDDKKRDEFLNSASLLPLATPEETRAYLSSQEIAHSITPDSPILLQEFIRGPEYATHALVVNGTLQAFTAVESSSMLMHYTALAPTTPAYTQMLDFTNKIISALVEEFGAQAVNGHLSFDFIQRQAGEGFVVDDMDDEAGLYVIECNPRAHTAVVLFSEDMEVAGRYLSAIEGDKTANGKGHPNGAVEEGVHHPQYYNPQKAASTPQPPKSYHWTGHDLVTLLISPALSLLPALIWDILRACKETLLNCPLDLLDSETRPRFPSAQMRARFQDVSRKRDLFWKSLFDSEYEGQESWDAVWDFWDPVPFFVLYHLYWPVRFFGAVWEGRGWSRVNVSTGKMFES